MQRVTTAVLLFRGEQLLLLHKTKRASIGACWEFAGGKARKGEHIEDTLIRECIEEVGFVPQEPRDTGYRGYFRHKDCDYELIGFVAEAPDEAVVLSEDHDDYIWASYDEIEALELAPSDRAFISWFRSEQEK